MDIRIHKAIFAGTSFSTVVIVWVALAAPRLTTKEIIWSCIVAGAHVVSGNKLLKEFK
jgi:hypothetical protein